VRRNVFSSFLPFLLGRGRHRAGKEERKKGERKGKPSSSSIEVRVKEGGGRKGKKKEDTFVLFLFSSYGGKRGKRSAFLFLSLIVLLYYVLKRGKGREGKKGTKRGTTLSLSNLKGNCFRAERKERKRKRKKGRKASYSLKGGNMNVNVDGGGGGERKKGRPSTFLFLNDRQEKGRKKGRGKREKCRSVLSTS